MQRYIGRMINLPYWAVALLVSVFFAVGIFIVFALGANFAVAIKVAPALAFLSLCGFGAAKFVIPNQTDEN